MVGRLKVDYSVLSDWEWGSDRLDPHRGRLT